MLKTSPERTILPAPSQDVMSRRRFVGLAGGALGISAAGPCAGASGVATSPSLEAPLAPTWARGDFSDRFDPWIEIDGAAFSHNVGEASRLAGGRPILAAWRAGPEEDRVGRM